MKRGKRQYLVSLYNELARRPKPLTDKEFRLKYGSILNNWTRGFR